ncbi:MAG: hypothetical protein NTY30_04155 [Candidatus Berkelbacteria bacterium]|nr:hypothetical protein [Candidatus Berkelbacteria bacterium]
MLSEPNGSESAHNPIESVNEGRQIILGLTERNTEDYKTDINNALLQFYSSLDLTVGKISGGDVSDVNGLKDEQIQEFMQARAHLIELLK